MYIRLLLMIIIGLIFGMIENYVSVPEPTSPQVEYQELYANMTKKDYLTDEEMNFLLEKEKEYMANMSSDDSVVDSKGFVAIAIFLLFVVVPFYIKHQKRLMYSIISMAAFFCSFSAFTSSLELIVYGCFGLTGIAIAYVGLWGMKKI